MIEVFPCAIAKLVEYATISNEEHDALRSKAAWYHFMDSDYLVLEDNSKYVAYVMASAQNADGTTKHHEILLAVEFDSLAPAINYVLQQFYVDTHAFEDTSLDVDACYSAYRANAI